MVEIPCIISAKADRNPFQWGKIPTFQKGLMEQQIAGRKLGGLRPGLEIHLPGSSWQALTLSERHYLEGRLLGTDTGPELSLGQTGSSGRDMGVRGAQKDLRVPADHK